MDSGLGDHARQVANFRTALAHATSRGYQSDTINLIPKHNIPITITEETGKSGLSLRE